LLYAPAKLLFKPEIRCSLHRRQERRQFLLLLIEQVDALVLGLDHPVHQVADLFLMRRVAPNHLFTKRHPDVPLLLHQRTSPLGKLRVRLLQLLDLRVRESEALASHLGDPVLHLPFERCAVPALRIG
jgi:hypothetical protein